MRTALVLAALSCLACLGVTAEAWAELPDTVPIHWDLAGRADGFAPRLVVLALGPVLGLLLPLVVAGAMRLDPGRAVLAESERAVTVALVGLAAFAPALQLAVVRAAVSPDQLLDLRLFQGALGLLVATLAFAMRHVGRNRAFGIRTPWTLGSDAVWDRTHALGSWTLGCGGLVCVALPWFLPAPGSLGLGVGAVLLGALVPVGASFAWARAERA